MREFIVGVGGALVIFGVRQARHDPLDARPMRPAYC